jgi:hypothetical protein
LKRVLILTALASVVVITVLHFWLNLDVKWFRSSKPSDVEGRFRIGFLPVT